MKILADNDRPNGGSKVKEEPSHALLQLNSDNIVYETLQNTILEIA